ncbi:TPA: hypothetical protein DCE37_06060 [Candidatus Latescibacteria bacterium]|nr:hypothetical protein [Candidatus Latescibacterota bacterium]
MKRMMVVLFGLALVISAPTHAGIGLYNIGPRVGKDVVQGDDTRTLWLVKADIATLFSPKVLLEVSGETGSGRDLGGRDVDVVGGSTIFKYYWVNRRKTAYAFTGGGLGVNRYRRFEAGAFRDQLDTSIHFVLLGMERHLEKLKGVFEVRWLLGNIEGATSLRVTLGISYKLRLL